MKAKTLDDIRIGVMDAAKTLNVRVSLLKEALESGSDINGIPPPQPIYKAGSGGLVFRLGDVMKVAEQISSAGDVVK